MAQFKVTRTKHVKESFVVEAEDCEAAMKLTEGEDREEVIHTEQQAVEYLRLPDTARRMEKMDRYFATLRADGPGFTGLGSVPVSNGREHV